VASLPNGSDPDSFVREAGVEGLERIVAAARGLVEHLINAAIGADFAAADVRSRAQRLAEVRTLLQAETDPAARAMAERHAAQSLARLLGITSAESATFRAIARSITRPISQRSTGRENRAVPPEAARSRDRRDEISLEILGALLDFPALLADATVRTAVGNLEGDVAAAIAALRQAWNGESFGPAEQVLAKLAPAIHPFAAGRLAAPRHERPESAREVLLGNVEKLERLKRKRHNSEAMAELQRAEAKGDFDEELAVLRELVRRRQTDHP
jgi:DNA primase